MALIRPLSRSQSVRQAATERFEMECSRGAVFWGAVFIADARWSIRLQKAFDRNKSANGNMHPPIGGGPSLPQPGISSTGRKFALEHQREHHTQGQRA